MRSRIRKSLVFFGLVFLVPTTALAQGEIVPPASNLSLIKDAAQSIAAGDLKRAESELNVVLETTPDDFRALNLLGIVRAQQRREPEAEGLFKRAIELKPESLAMEGSWVCSRSPSTFNICGCSPAFLSHE